LASRKAVIKTCFEPVIDFYSRILTGCLFIDLLLVTGTAVMFRYRVYWTHCSLVICTENNRTCSTMWRSIRKNWFLIFTCTIKFSQQNWYQLHIFKLWIWLFKANFMCKHIPMCNQLLKNLVFIIMIIMNIISHYYQ